MPVPSLPTLPADFTQGQFQVWWQQVVEAIGEAFEAQDDAIAAIAAANAAAAAASAAAATANTAAASATTAATTAQATADDITEASELANSYVTTGTPPILSASDAGTDATIAIGAHDRNYPQPDGSLVTVGVTGGSITGLAYDTFYYVYYDDAARAGGAVTFHATTDPAVAAQIGDRHTVGGVRTPLAGDPDNTGRNTDPPGTWGVRDTA